MSTVTINQKSNFVTVESLKVGSYFVYNDQLWTVMDVGNSLQQIEVWNVSHPSRRYIQRGVLVQEVNVNIEYEYKL